MANAQAEDHEEVWNTAICTDEIISLFGIKKVIIQRKVDLTPVPCSGHHIMFCHLPCRIV